jgi:hypothetical protein
VKKHGQEKRGVSWRGCQWDFSDSFLQTGTPSQVTWNLWKINFHCNYSHFLLLLLILFSKNSKKVSPILLNIHKILLLNYYYNLWNSITIIFTLIYLRCHWNG